MPAPLPDDKLTEWASEHLVYEGRMLAFATAALARRQREPRGADTNALLECFAIHVRCLDDFLWGQRSTHHPKDAFAADFCQQGVWERERPHRSPALRDARKRDRTGREIVHLTYHRSDVPAATKDWPVGAIATGILDALGTLTAHALPKRMDRATRAALVALPTALRAAATPSAQSYRGGTIPFHGP
jgi:hypothetical protein